MKVGKISDFSSTLWRDKGRDCSQIRVSLRCYEDDNGMKEREVEIILKII